MIIRKFDEENDGYIFCLRFLNGNRRLMITTAGGPLKIQKTSLWDLREEIRLYSEPMLIRPLAFSPNSRLFIETGPEGAMTLWKILTSTREMN